MPRVCMVLARALPGHGKCVQGKTLQIQSPTYAQNYTHTYTRTSKRTRLGKDSTRRSRKIYLGVVDVSGVSRGGDGNNVVWWR